MSQPAPDYLWRVAALAAALATSYPASANDLYIEQITTDSTVTISQTGGSNTIAGAGSLGTLTSGVRPTDHLQIDFPVASVDDPMRLSGSNLEVNLTQTGSHNTLGVDISGSSSRVDVTQEGDSNEGRLFMNGTDNQISLTVTGDSNKTNIEVGKTTTEANKNEVTATIKGDTNQFNLLHTPTGSTTDGSKYTVSVTGSTNAVRIENTGTEPSTMSLTLGSSAHPSSSNVITITKAGN